MTKLHPLSAGTVIRCSSVGELYVAIVRGPTVDRQGRTMDQCVDVICGQLGKQDAEPMEIHLDRFRDGTWLLATDEDRTKILLGFGRHAFVGPVAGATTTPWTTPRVAMTWENGWTRARLHAELERLTQLLRDLQEDHGANFRRAVDIGDALDAGYLCKVIERHPDRGARPWADVVADFERDDELGFYGSGGPGAAICARNREAERVAAVAMIQAAGLDPATVTEEQASAVLGTDAKGLGFVQTRDFRERERVIDSLIRHRLAEGPWTHEELDRHVDEGMVRAGHVGTSTHEVTRGLLRCEVQPAPEGVIPAAGG